MDNTTWKGMIGFAPLAETPPRATGLANFGTSLKHYAKILKHTS